MLLTDCPYAPLPLQENDRGMIVIHQEKHPKHGDRIPIPKETILIAYSTAAVEMENGFPRKPQYGFGTKSKYGDWYAYNDMQNCVLFVEENPVIILEVEVGEPPVATQVQLTTKAVSLAGPLKEGKISAMAMHNLTLHVVVHISNGTLFDRVTTKMLSDAFVAHDFIVFKANQAGVAVGGVSLKGKGTRTEGYHFNIRPLNGDLCGSDYPPFLKIKVEGTTQYIDYRIFPHPDIEGKLCLDGCHRYFAQVAIQYNLRTPYCYNTCKNVSKRKQTKPFGRSADGSIVELPTGEAALEKAVADKLLLMGTTECDHFLTGTCYATIKNKACKFKHTADPNTIQCGVCPKGKAKPTCVYMHFVPCTPPATIDEAMSGDLCMYYASRNRMVLIRKLGIWVVTRRAARTSSEDTLRAGRGVRTRSEDEE